MVNTDNHDLLVPALNQEITEGQGWGEILNQALQYLDDYVIIRDLEANRSDYSPVEGVLFLATDTTEIFYGDGSSWVEPDFGGGADGEDITPSSVDTQSVITAALTLGSNAEITSLTGQGLEIQNSTLKTVGSETGIEGTTGTAVRSGDSSTTIFTVTHGLGEIPTYTHVDPTTVAASADFTVNADSTSITIEYASPPPQGTENLEWSWAAVSNTTKTLGDLEVSHNDLINVSESDHRTDENVISTVENSSNPVDLDVDKRTYLQHAMDSPNVSSDRYRLKDGDSIVIGSWRVNKRVMEVWRWGIMTGSGGADTNLELVLENYNGTESARTSSNDERGDLSTMSPAAVIGYDFPQFRMVNNTGSTVTASAFALTYGEE